MAVKLNGDGGFGDFFGRFVQNLGSRSNPEIGDLIQVKRGESVLAPPKGKLWHSPSWSNGSVYQLHDLIRRPIFGLGDVFGIHPRDPVPLPPSGSQLLRLVNPAAPLGETAAVLYKIVEPPALSAVMALPKPKPPTLQAYAIGDQPLPEPGHRWQVAYVDGRNLQRVVGALVAA